MAGAENSKAVDWASLNAAAREDALRPVRLGEPGVHPFWNAHSRAFIHPPAFDFGDIPGVEEYRFELFSAASQDPTSEDTTGRDDAAAAHESSAPLQKSAAAEQRAATWRAAHPWEPIPREAWDSLPPGYYTLRVEPASESVRATPGVYTRSFYRAAPFSGPYPEAPRGYREAAARVYAAVAALPQVRGWLDSDEPPEGYDLYCYPSKILGSMIRALCRDASRDSIEIARRMADWLLAHSEPEGAPLAHFPPTYWGNRRRVAVENAGRIMLSYPAQAALAYFVLADALEKSGGTAADADRYRAAALAIVRTYVRLQGEDGTWPLLVRASDGAELCPNRIVPGRYIFGMFDRAIEAAVSAQSQAPSPDARESGEAAAAMAVSELRPTARASGEAAALADSFAAARDRAFAYIEHGALATWNWDGQFEDSKPRPPYQNLQKGVAIDTAVRLFSLGRTADALECVRWCEDQFTVWASPIHHMDWRHWKLPTALEQYDYYTPIDASMADMVRGFSAAYAATGDQLWRAKAKAMADCLVRHQRADGTIPTYFDERGAGSDWVNCMIYSASSLETAADAGVGD